MQEAFAFWNICTHHEHVLLNSQFISGDYLYGLNISYLPFIVIVMQKGAQANRDLRTAYYV